MRRFFVSVVAVLCFMAIAAPAHASGWEALSSCYGDELAGNLTASGEVFDPSAPTVAHKTLPFGTEVLFNYGGHEVLGVVNDRGPFHGDREFDLSCGLMADLGLSPGVYWLGVTLI